MLLGIFEWDEKLRFIIIRCCVLKSRLEVTSVVDDMCMHFNLLVSLLVPVPPWRQAFLFLIFKEKFRTAGEKKKSAKNLFSVCINEMTDGFKGLNISELRFPKMVMNQPPYVHISGHLSQLQCCLSASARQPQSHPSTSLPSQKEGD